ncbi:hypothetical protein BGZ65_011502, partial [Modicella reniformis]
SSTPRNEFVAENEDEVFFGPHYIRKCVLPEKQEDVLDEIIREGQSFNTEDYAHFFIRRPQGVKDEYQQQQWEVAILSLRSVDLLDAIAADEW